MTEQIIWKSIDDFCDSFSKYPINTKGHYLVNYTRELIDELEKRTGRPDAEAKFLLLNDVVLGLFKPLIVDTTFSYNYIVNSITDDIFVCLNKPWTNNLAIIEGPFNDEQQKIIYRVHDMFLKEPFSVRIKIIKYLVALFGTEIHYQEPIKQFISSFVLTLAEAIDKDLVIELKIETDTINIYNSIKDDPVLHSTIANFLNTYKNKK